MPIPFHTFDDTGDPMVDDFHFFEKSDRCHSYTDWFKANPHVLMHTADEIIRDADPYKQGDGANGRGIYVLVSENEIAYVGKALTVWERLRSHRRSGKEFDRYWCFGGVPYAYLEYVEEYYIRRLKPYLNKVYGRGTAGWKCQLDRIAEAAAREQASVLD